MFNDSYQSKYYCAHAFDPGDQIYLSLWIGPGSVQHAISLNGFNQVFELGHLDFGISNLNADHLNFYFHHFSLQNRKFSAVNAAVLNHDFALIPQSFSGTDEARQYLRFSSGKDQLRNVFSHGIRDMRFCYTLDPEILSTLEALFQGVSIRHAGAVNLQLFYNHRSLVRCGAAVFLNNGVLELAIRDQENLLVYNAFDTTTADDILYFVLASLEQYRIDPSAVQLGLAAQSPLDEDSITRLRRYLPRLQPVVCGEPVKTHKDISKLPGHYYFTLLNQHLCEL
ncbi:MAG TPA: DUF3822 family protein [Bacteroidia bacterium]|nr:DUF3822 family protein [Bacteroidia bacterium]